LRLLIFLSELGLDPLHGAAADAVLAGDSVSALATGPEFTKTSLYSRGARSLKYIILLLYNKMDGS
jgi:hypothetical protein